MAFAASKRKRIKSHLKPFGQLNLNSLIDMFTIILVFLLKSYSAVEFNVQISDDLHLPTSISQKLPVDTVVLTVARNAILVDGGRVTDVDKEFEVPGVDPEATSIPDLKAVLQSKFQTFNTQAEARGEKYLGEITVQADKDIPYKLLKRVIKSAGEAQFSTIKMMAFKQEGEAETL